MGKRDGQICSRDGCGRPEHSRGLCSSDYAAEWYAGRVGRAAQTPAPAPQETPSFPPAPDFLHRGLCAGRDSSIWFPEPGDEIGLKRAQAICAACPARSECAAYALSTREQWGVWGGVAMEKRQHEVAA